MLLARGVTADVASFATSTATPAVTGTGGGAARAGGGGGGARMLLAGVNVGTVAVFVLSARYAATGGTAGAGRRTEPATKLDQLLYVRVLIMTWRAFFRIYLVRPRIRRCSHCPCR